MSRFASPQPLSRRRRLALGGLGSSVLVVKALVTIVSLVALVGCSGPNPAATPMQSSTPSTSASSAPAPEPVAELTIAVADGKVTPAPSRFKVDLGSKVRLTVTSDSADKVHLHGYDIEKPVGPGKPATLTFRADQAGLFELETHEEPVLILTQVQVQ